MIPVIRYQILNAWSLGWVVCAYLSAGLQTVAGQALQSTGRAAAPTYDLSRYEQAYRQIAAENAANSEAFTNLREQTEQSGHRLSGTPNGRKAEDFVLLKAKSYGIKPLRYQPFPIQTWERRFIDLEVVPRNSDHFVRYEAVALAHSPVEADVRASVIDCGNGLREDFEVKTSLLAGQIALVNIGLEGVAKGTPEARKNLHRSEKTALAIEFGAVGVIFVNSAPGRTLLTGTASVSGDLIPIPALCIGQEAGKSLRQWNGEEQLTATIRMENSFSVREARNVVATLRGTTRPDETIVVGAHLDSWDLATGAVDNGLGAFTILEAARILKALKLPMERSVEFVFFMGEEQGLVGSKHYIDLARKYKRLPKVKYMLNLDMAGNAQGWNGGALGRSADYFSALGRVVAAQDTGFHNASEAQAELHSDHQPFMLQGIPVAQPIADMPASVYHCYHADCDKINLIDPAWMDRSARLTALTILALANERDLPATRQTDEQTRTYLIRQGLKEPLQLGGEWRWGK